MVTLFAFLFNGSRWFEITFEFEEVRTYENQCVIKWIFEAKGSFYLLSNEAAWLSGLR